MWSRSYLHIKIYSLKRGWYKGYCNLKKNLNTILPTQITKSMRTRYILLLIFVSFDRKTFFVSKTFTCWNCGVDTFVVKDLNICFTTVSYTEYSMFSLLLTQTHLPFLFRSLLTSGGRCVNIWMLVAALEGEILSDESR